MGWTNDAFNENVFVKKINHHWISNKVEAENYREMFKDYDGITAIAQGKNVYLGVSNMEIDSVFFNKTVLKKIVDEEFTKYKGRIDFNKELDGLSK